MEGLHIYILRKKWVHLYPCTHVESHIMATVHILRSHSLCCCDIKKSIFFILFAIIMKTSQIILQYILVTSFALSYSILRSFLFCLFSFTRSLSFLLSHSSQIDRIANENWWVKICWESHNRIKYKKAIFFVEHIFIHFSPSISILISSYHLFVCGNSCVKPKWLQNPQRKKCGFFFASFVCNMLWN